MVDGEEYMVDLCETARRPARNQPHLTRLDKVLT